MLEPPADALARLATLKDARKFDEDPDDCYAGVRDPGERVKAEEAINSSITAVAAIMRRGPDTGSILEVFRAGLDRLTLADTEDRERACSYFEQIMDCIGLDSSEGQLNEWLYGLDPA